MNQCCRIINVKDGTCQCPAVATHMRDGMPYCDAHFPRGVMPASVEQLDELQHARRVRARRVSG